MTIEQARALALENMSGDDQRDCLFLDYSDLLLRPIFWQSLGKAMGWERTLCHKHALGCILEHPCECTDGFLAYWHRFIDHLADGGTPKTYFEGLSNPTRRKEGE